MLNRISTYVQLKKKLKKTSYCLSFFFYFNQVNTLGGDAERLQQTHPQNASQIHLKKDELITNWEQIRTLAAERHARLNDSYQ